MLDWFRRLSDTAQGIIVAVTLGVILFAVFSLLR